MRVLVTGGAGFIGSTTAEHLIDLGHDVVVVDDLSGGRRDNVPSAARFVEADFGDERVITSLGPFDGCVHFAGLIAPGDSMREPDRFFVTNVSKTLVLVQTLIRLGVPRFVFSSSCAVYGDDVTIPIDESHPLRPHSPYGESKLMVESALRWLGQLGLINAISLRYFNAAGGTPAHPERHEPEFHLIPLALAAAAGDRDGLDLYGTDYETPDGTCIRDYIHVSDLASAHALALDALSDHQWLAINIGSGTGFSCREILEAVRRVTGREFEIREVDRRPGDPAAAVASNALATSVLGWRPQRTQIDEIVADAWAAYQVL